MTRINVRTALVAAALLSATAGCSCTTVRQLRSADTVTADAPTQKTRSEDALDYSVSKNIAAPPEKVWKVLTDASRYTSWNSTVVKLDGSIALGQKIALVSKDAPDKTFELAVTTFEPAKHMVWEDGGSMFLGVRHFTLLPSS